MSLKLKQFIFNPFQENTYLLFDDQTREAIVIDPGCYSSVEQQSLMEFIEQQSLCLKAIVATHIHIDHLFGVPFLKRECDVEFLAHRNDVFLYDRLPDQAEAFGFDLYESIPAVDRFVEHDDIITLGESLIRVIHVPGHSPGSVALYLPKEGILISGDVLFNQSIGRTDLPGGNFDQLIFGIKNRLLVLPEETVVYPGHGPKTTIGAEKNGNPFL